MKILRNIVFGLIGLILLLVAAVAVAMIVIDPNDYKPHIERVAAEHTNLELSLDGDIRWSFIPLGLEVNDVEARLDDEELVSLDQLVASVDLWSLIRMSPSVHTFTVDGLAANLYLDEDGVGNWERIMPEAAPDEAEAAPEEALEEEVALTDEDGETELISFNVQQVRIGDASVRFRDLESGQDISLTDTTLEASNIALGQDFPLELGFAVALNEPELDLDGQLSMLINASDDLQRFAVRDLDSEFNMSGEPFNGESVTAGLSGALEANLADETATLDELVASFENISATTNLSVTGFDESPELDGDFSIAEFSAVELMDRLGQDPIETDDGDVLKRISLSTDIITENGTATLSDFLLRLDDTEFAGMLGYGLDDGAITVDLQGDELNLDRYLPPKDEDAADDEAVADNGEEADRDAELLPLEALRELSLDVRLGLDELIATNLTISEILVRVTGDEGQLSLDELSGELYEGDFNITAELDARTDDPSWSFDQRLTDVRSQPLLVDLIDLDLLSGRINVNANADTRGNSINALLENSDGKADFAIDDGAIENVNLTEMACRGISQVHGESLQDNDWGDSTPFNDMRGEMVIDSGVLRNEELTADLAGIRLEGDGMVNLIESMLEYRLGLRIVGDVHRDEACRVNERVQNVVIPVLCSGSFSDDPAGLCRFDTRRFSEVLTSMGRAEIDRQRERLEERAREETDKLRKEAEERAEREKERARDRVEDEGRRLFDRLR